MLPTTRGEQPFRILLADRSEETRELFTALFGGMGHEVRAVTTGTEALASGDLSHRVVIPSEDELGELGEAFNDMA